jgi:uncharacterized membrane protein YeaQ/YmgE (transglycosylase-associated protein family)
MPVVASRIVEAPAAAKSSSGSRSRISTGALPFSTGGGKSQGWRWHVADRRANPAQQLAILCVGRLVALQEEVFMLGIIGTIVVGLIVGAIAKLISPGRDPSGWIITILVGIAGAFIAKFIGQSLFGWYRDGDAPGWIMSIAGAVLLLWIYKLVTRNRAA